MDAIRWTTLRPANPPLTEKNLPDQSGKVFIVTGASSGVGKDLATILYQHNATVYLATRSETKTTDAIKEIKAKHPESKGEAIFLKLELDDLTTIKKSAQEFLAKESRLDVLWLNAGVMTPPQGSKTKQGYELQLGTNNLGHFLFEQLLLPVIKQTAKTAPKNSVRIIWVSSSGADGAPKPAVDFDNITYEKKDEGAWTKYFRSKAGNALHSSESARQTKGTGIINIALNPGNLKTGLQQHMGGLSTKIFYLLAAYPSINGAYTELFAGLHPSVTEAHNGGWVVPFGKIEPIRKDLAGEEIGKKYWDWTVEQVSKYM